MQNINYWAADLTKTEMLPEAIATALEEIDSKGIEEGFVIFRDRMASLKKI